MQRPTDNADHETPPLSFEIARRLAAAGALYHRAAIDGLEHLPRGPALLVGNHGLFGLDTPVFFYLVWKATGRRPVGLAERLLCFLPPMRRILHEIGGVEGTRENALRLLAQGKWVVCYPGGAREVFKDESRKHQLSWQRALGFVKVARDAQAPIVPVAGAGIDDTYRVVARLPIAGEKYAIPVGVGLGLAPLPARFRFRIGRPIDPPRVGSEEEELLAVRHRVQAQVEEQLSELTDG